MVTDSFLLSELPVIDAERMAIQEINLAGARMDFALCAHSKLFVGGVLGKQITPTILDGQSDATVFASQAALLLANPSIDSVFGCWSSASRKAVKPLFEASDKLLFYPGTRSAATTFLKCCLSQYNMRDRSAAPLCSTSVRRQRRKSSPRSTGRSPLMVPVAIKRRPTHNFDPST